MIIAQTDKFILRTWKKEDAFSLAKQLNNKKIWDNCRDALPYPYEFKHAQSIIEKIKQKDGIHDFCIEVNGQAIGNIGFMPENDIQRYNAEVGYIIGESYWDKGITTAALNKAIEYYLNHTEIKRVYAFVFEHNIGSMRVLEKNNFIKIGIMRKSIFKNNHFIDAHYYEFLKADIV